MAREDDRSMPNRERRLPRATALIRADLTEAGSDLRTARLRAGLTAAAVAKAIGSSESTVLRTERAVRPGVRPDALARHAAALGLRARIRLYPDGDPIRDAAQVSVMRSFRERIGTSVPMLLEVPIQGNANDRRAFDAVLRLPTCRCGVEFYTRFHDCQGQLRAAHLKFRDAGLDRLIIVVKATHANRRALAAAADIIATTFPLGTRQILSALAAGRDPGANGIVLL
jgi:transcriptional regulator with XRE-family HTH domain